MLVLCLELILTVESFCDSIYLMTDILHFLRAILFGATVSFAITFFIKFFKPIVEDLFHIKRINVDLWWWIGVLISIIAGILLMLLLL